MTKVTVDAGACGFRSGITANKEDRRSVRIEIESDCDSVAELGEKLKDLGLLGLGDVLGKGTNGNRILATGMNTLSHSGCPVLSAIIKVCEVELGLNIPCPVRIEFQEEPKQSD
ncbi:MAG: hypothetical protein HY912_24715 [Desulfomonile tiedjei]|uniref:Uncharacterized protein n=1 Tax=Desulfomonile tiedjei TaxID=2358 RepID=A0A9D6V5Y0_9BACT|nr:hypothetical protein [Desulfomonile tiedjei]